MARFTGSIEIYDQLVQDLPGSWLLSLLTFAVVEEMKFEWMKHHAENMGRSATDEEVRGWYEALPAAALVRSQGVAESILKNHADLVQAAFSESVRKDVEHSALMGEIRQGRRFWPQFGLSVAGGIASSILFGSLLFLVAFLVLNDRSPVGIGASIVKDSAVESADDSR